MKIAVWARRAFPLACSLLAFVSLACSFAERLLRPAIATSPTPRPTPTRERRLSGSADEWLDSLLVGWEREPLWRVELSGTELAASGLGEEEPLVAWGPHARDASAAFAATLTPGAEVWLVGVLQLPGRDWQASLEELAASPPPGTMMEWSQARRAPVLRVVHGGSLGAGYVAVGDVLIFVRSDDPAVVEAVMLRATAVAGSASFPDLPETGTSTPGAPLAQLPPVPLMLAPPPNGLCVGEPWPARVWLLALDGRTGVPSPDAEYLLSGLHTETRTPEGAPAGVLELQASDYAGGHPAVLNALTRTGWGPPVSAELEIATAHCLDGTWRDGERELTVESADGLYTAEITSGALECGATGLAFRGELEGDRLSGSGLLVCNPQPCVTAGLLPQTTRVPFQGMVARNGVTVTLRWTAVQFDIVFEPGDTVASCDEVGHESRSFVLERLAWPGEGP